DRRDGVREPGGQGAPARNVAHALVGDVHASGGYVLDPRERHADALARRDHRPAEEIVDAYVREPAAVAPDGGAHAAYYECVGHSSSGGDRLARRGRGARVAGRPPEGVVGRLPPS